MENESLRTEMSNEAVNMSKRNELIPIMELWQETFSHLIKKQ